jgi:hypothetical protein
MDAGMEMSTAPAWPRVKWTRASQVAPLMGEELGAVDTLPPAQAFAVLRAGDPAAAARFAAHCLPRVDAVRWLAECLEAVGGDRPPALIVAAKAVRRWAASPSDEARRLAFEAGAIAGWETVEGLACLAVYFSGGSLAPATQEAPVNPPAGAFGQAAGSAVLLAAQAAGAEAYPARIAAMLDRADAIAAGEAR